MRFRLWLETVALPRTLYHGTASEFESFDLASAGARDWGDFGVGVYLTPKATLARIYAAAAAKQGGAPMILVVEHALQNAANFDDPKFQKEVMEATGVPFPKDISKLINGKQTRPREDAEAITRYALSQGYDSGVGRQGAEVVAYDPQKLRIVQKVTPEEASYLL